MGRSSSSDSDRSRKKKKQKYDRYRSRSRSTSSDRSRRRSNYKSTRGRSRSRSRDRRRSRSWSRSNRSRSRSKDRRNRSYKKREKSRSPSRDRYHSRRYPDKDIKEKSEKGNISLKDKVKALTVAAVDSSNKQPIIPSLEDIEKIEKDSFSQQSFLSTTLSAGNQPKQSKKKKKGKNKQKLQKANLTAGKQEVTSESTGINTDLISHESAIFGNSLETMHIGRFSSRIDQKRKEELKTVDNDDLIFGAMFCEDPKVRMDRWIEKLTDIRTRIRNGGMVS